MPGQLDIVDQILIRLTRESGDEPGRDVPTVGRQVTDVVESFVVVPGGLHPGIEVRVSDFELHDVERGARIFQLLIKRVVERAEADTNPERRLLSDGFDEGDDEVPNCDWIFAGLDIDVGDRLRTLMND